MGRTHPSFQAAEGMLYRLPADAHAVGRFVQTSLHGIENLFMFPTANTPIVAGRTLSFNIALRTMRAPVTIQLQTIFHPGKSPN